MNSEPAGTDVPPQPPPVAPKTAARRMGGAAALVAAGIMLSRIAGLVRNRVFAHYLGASAAADAFNAAIKTPNFLQNLLGEGVLSASFIPVYARLVAKDDEKLAGRVAGVVASFLLLGVSVVVLVGVLLAPFVMRITFPGFDQPTMDLAVRLVRITFPGIGVLVMYAWAIGILNTHKQFFLSYVAPVLWNAAMIATLIIFGARMNNVDLAVALAWGFLVGCGLQFGVLLPFVFRHARHLKVGLDWSLQPVRDVFRNLAPVTAGRGVVQISGYIDTFIGSMLAPGSVTNIVYAQAIYMLPISVFGMAVANAELPEMSREKGTAEEIAVALRRRLDRGLRQVAFFVIPTSVAFILIGRLLVAALYQGGEFTAQHTLLVWYMLMGSTVGLLAATLGRLYSSAYYALQDTKTPFRIAIARMIIGASLGFLLAFPLRPWISAALQAAGMPIPQGVAVGAVGITLASGLSAVSEFFLLRRGMTKRLGKGEPKGAFYLKLWIAALAGGAAAFAFDRFIGRAITSGLPLPYVNEAFAACIVFGIVYFAMGMLLGVQEVRATLSRFTRR